MSRIKRRQFLQGVGGAIAALGLNQFELQRQSLRYAQVLAQNTPRKLALLVGINAYPEPLTLHGCVTDVDLQRELLVHRFGFNPKDIFSLTDGQATRQGLLDAFESHLIQQAKPGDVVVFHYSGHGSQVVDIDRDHVDGLNGTLVPIDSQSRFENGREVMNDIMGHTLFLLMSAVQTEQLTVVLDSCYSGGGTRGNLRVRAIPRLQRDGGLYPTQAELAYQQQWLTRLGLSPETFKQKRRAGVAKGVAIASAKRNQLAADAPFNGFTAGAFTYYMTRYLWQETGNTSVVNAMTHISRRTTQDLEQDPDLECTPDCKSPTVEDPHPFYFLNSVAPPAEAVLLNVSGQTFTCWLGGVDPASVMAENSILAVVNPQGQELAKVRLDQRQGLIGKGTFLSGQVTALQPGALLQEEVRGIPTDLTLRIGIDPSLGDQQALAKMVLAKNPRISVVPLQEGPVDYILGAMTPEDRKRLQTQRSDLPAVGAYGLFSPTKERIIADSFTLPVVGNDPIEAAIQRLQPKLKLLLANRILKAILNPGTARLAVAATVRPLGERAAAPVANVRTGRGIHPSQGQRGASATVTEAVTNPIGQVKPGDMIQIQAKNSESQDLYIAVLAIGSEGEMSVLHPVDYTAAEDATLVGAGQTLMVPPPGPDHYDFEVTGPAGSIEVLVLASAVPLRNTLKSLQKIATRNNHERGLPLGLVDPVDAATDLLTDTTRATRAFLKFKRSEKTRLVDVTRIAALSIRLDVVEA